MKYILLKFVFLFAFVCNAFAVFVETLDEQVESKNLTVLRLRVNNETDQELHNVKVKYFVQKKPQESLTIDPYDLGGANVSLDSLTEDVWTITLSIDTLHPGMFPYESGACLGLHDIGWQNRDKRLDPSYIASSSFTVNNNVELNLNGNHLPDAKPLVLASGTKILIDNGDSVPFAWHGVPGAERYRLSVYSSDSQLVYQKETIASTERVLLEAGDYLWQVESKNSVTDYGLTGAGALVNFLRVEDFQRQKILEQNVHGIVSVSGHKDTPMLVVGWGEYADLREWDRPHLGRKFLDENEANSCWAIAIKNLNRYYGGNLSLDEIRWFVQKDGGEGIDSINAFRFGKGAEGYPSDIKKGLKYALDSLQSYDAIQITSRPLTYDGVKNYLDDNKEIYINMSLGKNGEHVMLIDGYYTTDKEHFIRCVNVDNFGHYAIFQAESLFKDILWYIIIEEPKSVRNMSPLLGIERFNNFNTWIEWTDTDNDGVTDFDEVFRFGTDPNSADSDSDGVKDKDEIHSYTILERSRLNLSGSYVGKNVDLAGMAIIAGIENEYMADVDGDGLRAERDPDSDNDGIPDSADSEPYRANRVKDSLGPNELPKEVMLYARKQLSVNDGATCENGFFNYCIYASEDTEFDYSILMGARTSAAYLYARNNVFIRSNPDNMFSVNYYGSESLSTMRTDGKMTVDRHFSLEEWPWDLNIELPDFDEGDSVLVIHSGDTIPLRDNDHFKTLKVESNGVVCLPVGNVYIGNLQLDAGSRIHFENHSRNTTIYVKHSVLWKSTSSYVTGLGFDYRHVAENFKFVYYGDKKIFFDSDWYGTIMAPNAKVILGQTHRKNIYGQIYANEIVIHQFSNLVNTPFKPDQLPLNYAIKNF